MIEAIVYPVSGRVFVRRGLKIIGCWADLNDGETGTMSNSSSAACEVIRAVSCFSYFLCASSSPSSCHVGCDELELVHLSTDRKIERSKDMLLFELLFEEMKKMQKPRARARATEKEARKNGRIDYENCLLEMRDDLS